MTEMKVAAKLPNLDREVVYAKLMFISNTIGNMEDRLQDYDDHVFFAMAVMLSDIAREIWPNREREE